jgi:hypothetical protein
MASAYELSSAPEHLRNLVNEFVARLENRAPADLALLDATVDLFRRVGIPGMLAAAGGQGNQVDLNTALDIARGIMAERIEDQNVVDQRLNFLRGAPQVHDLDTLDRAIPILERVGFDAADPTPLNSREKRNLRRAAEKYREELIGADAEERREQIGGFEIWPRFVDYRTMRQGGVNEGDQVEGIFIDDQNIEIDAIGPNQIDVRNMFRLAYKIHQQISGANPDWAEIDRNLEQLRAETELSSTGVSETAVLYDRLRAYRDERFRDLGSVFNDAVVDRIERALIPAEVQNFRAFVKNLRNLQQQLDNLRKRGISTHNIEDADKNRLKNLYDLIVAQEQLVNNLAGNSRINEPDRDLVFAEYRRAIADARVVIGDYTGSLDELYRDVFDAGHQDVELWLLYENGGAYWNRIQEVNFLWDQYEAGNTAVIQRNGARIEELINFFTEALRRLHQDNFGPGMTPDVNYAQRFVVLDVQMNRLQELRKLTFVEPAGSSTPSGERTPAEKLLDPHNRKDWLLEDYFNYLAHTLQATVGQSGSLAVEIATEARTKIDLLTDEKMRYFWWTKLAIYNMLIKAESPSGKDYSIELKNIWGAPTFKFERNYFLEGFLYHELFGQPVRLILQIIKQLLTDRTGPYAAKKLNPANVDAFQAEIKRRFEGLGYVVLDTAKNPAEEAQQLQRMRSGERVLPGYVFSTAVDFPQSTAERDKEFLDDTAEAVTKGFGGEDFTAIFNIGTTVAYDLNRYERGAKPTYLLLAGLHIPGRWSEKAAWNNQRLDDQIADPAERLEKERIATREGEARKELVIRAEEEIRTWWQTFFPEGEWQRAVAQSFAFNDQTNSPAVDSARDGFYLTGGAIFPTPYDIMLAQPNEIDENGNFKKTRYEFKNYEVAWQGWKAAQDIVFAQPKPIDAKSAEKTIDDFLAALGKAKIVPGRHHNMMNYYALVVFTKVFKWLNPPSGSAYAELKRSAIKKVGETGGAGSAYGGGIENHVRKYLQWLISTDYLKPKQLSGFDVAGYEFNRAREEVGGWRGLVQGSLAAVEGMSDMGKPASDSSPAGAYKIPDGPIHWGEKTDVKGGADKK